MDITKGIMTFELLPTEMLVKCFEYLNATDIFYAFDQLNYRLNRLIRNIPLHFNFQCTPKCVFHQFCNMITSDSDIQNQVYSLHLFKNITYDQINIFITVLSFEKFPRLKSLSLNGLNENEIKQFIQKKPLLSNLFYLSFMNCPCEIIPLLISLSTSTIKTLLIQRIPLLSSPLINKLTTIVNLIIQQCDIEKLCLSFKYFPMLKYSQIQYLKQSNGFKDFDTLQFDKYVANHLKKLIIHITYVSFDFLEILLKQIPNLKFLSLCVIGNVDLIDANRWEKLIIYFIPYLQTFNFQFKVQLKSKSDLTGKFEGFQSAFWHLQHHWYTSYETTNSNARVYTVPYLTNSYMLWSDIIQYYTGNRNMYRNITDLSLCTKALKNVHECYFDNVTSLKLICQCGGSSYTCPGVVINYVECIKRLINLYNLTRLTLVSFFPCKLPSLLLELLKEAPNISSLRIIDTYIYSLCDDAELCEYLNKMIKKLDLSSYQKNTLRQTKSIVQLCQIFSNIEQLECDIRCTDNITFLLHELSTLRNFNLLVFRANHSSFDNGWFKQHGIELNKYSFIVQCNYLNTENHTSSDFNFSDDDD